VSSDRRVAGLFFVALLLSGCGCFKRSPPYMCGMAVALPLLPAMAVAKAIGGPPKRAVEGIETVTHLGGERIGMRVVAVGGGGGGRLLYQDARGAAVVGGFPVCPPEQHVRLRTTSLDADLPPSRHAVWIAPFADTAFKRLSVHEVRVEVPWTGDARSVAIPVSDGAQVREARQVYVLPCGPVGRAVLVVAEAAETTGVDVFEVVFRRASQE
jgi:hypothetical protein